jgi:hypothetical protein
MLNLLMKNHPELIGDGKHGIKLLQERGKIEIQDLYERGVKGRMEYPS